MQGWQYGKELVYLRPIFWLTKLAFLRARATLKENVVTAPPKINQLFAVFPALHSALFQICTSSDLWHQHKDPQERISLFHSRVEWTSAHSSKVFFWRLGLRALVDPNNIPVSSNIYQIRYGNFQKQSCTTITKANFAMVNYAQEQYEINFAFIVDLIFVSSRRQGSHRPDVRLFLMFLCFLVKQWCCILHSWMRLPHENVHLI